MLKLYKIHGWEVDLFTGQFKNPRSLAFNNFKPRNYDYEELEKRLLGWSGMRVKEIEQQINIYSNK